eukprot:Polyplicarium_translucidae@DN811_c0_g1_i1.p1
MMTTSACPRWLALATLSTGIGVTDEAPLRNNGISPRHRVDTLLLPGSGRMRTPALYGWAWSVASAVAFLGWAGTGGAREAEGADRDRAGQWQGLARPWCEVSTERNLLHLVLFLEMGMGKGGRIFALKI